MVTEVAEDVFRVESEFGGRNLYLYLLRGSETTLLIDSGASVTPDESLIGALASLGAVPDLLIVTHPDLDHQGGTPRLRAVYEGMEVACGAGDEELVSDPRRLVAERYSAFEYDHGVGFPVESKPRFIELAGSTRVPVTRRFCGGEHLRLGEDWTVEVLHLPGHSPGHLGIDDPRSRSAITQDAVQGADCPHADGTPWALMPTYFDVEPYLRSTEALRSLDLQTLHTAHWPPAEGVAVGKRLDETRGYVLRADKAIFELLQEGKSTLSELMDAALPLLGEWPSSKIGDFASSVHGHLQRFLDSRIAQATKRDGVIHYSASGEYSQPLA